MNEPNKSHPMLYGTLVARPGAPFAESSTGSGHRLNKVALTVLGATLLSLLTLL